MGRSKAFIGKVLIVTIILSGAFGWLFATFSYQARFDPKAAEARALAAIKWARAERDRANAEPARRMDEISAKQLDRSIVPGSAHASSK
jgi:hypothetical protein